MLQPLIYWYWYNKSQQLPANSILHVASLCPRSYSTFLGHSRHSFFTGHHRHETPRHQLLQRRTCRDRQHVGNIWIWRDFWNDVLLEQKNIKNIMYLISTLMYVILQHLDVLKYIEIGIIIQRKSSFCFLERSSAWNPTQLLQCSENARTLPCKASNQGTAVFFLSLPCQCNWGCSINELPASTTKHTAGD